MKPYHLLAVIVFLFYGVSCGGDDSVGTGSEKPPVVKSFTPQKGEPGMTLTLKGRNFSAEASENIVTFKGTQAEVKSATSTQLVVVVPEGLKADQYLISVSVVGQSQSAISTEKYSVLSKVELAWEEDFNGDKLDTSKWYHRYPGERGDGFNNESSVIVEDGNLNIKVYSDSVNAALQHYTGMIATKKEFKFGKIEARISFSNQSGTHSGFWMQSPTYGKPIGDPGKAGVEIDMVETITNDGRAFETLHWDGYGADHKKAQNITEPIGTNSGDFHTYALRWTPESYQFYIDDKLMWTHTDAVSHRCEYIILSTGVDDYPVSTWAGPIPDGGYGSLENTSTIMKVDYVKYYSLQN